MFPHNLASLDVDKVFDESVDPVSFQVAIGQWHIANDVNPSVRRIIQRYTFSRVQALWYWQPLLETFVGQLSLLYNGGETEFTINK